jgi:hypothetical protein
VLFIHGSYATVIYNGDATKKLVQGIRITGTRGSGMDDVAFMRSSLSLSQVVNGPRYHVVLGDTGRSIPCSTVGNTSAHRCFCSLVFEWSSISDLGRPQDKLCCGVKDPSS